MKFKFLIGFSHLLFFGIAVSSCKKEYSIEKASGSLKDSLNNCSPVEITGHYKAGMEVNTAAYYVNVKVNITHRLLQHFYRYQ